MRAKDFGNACVLVPDRVGGSKLLSEEDWKLVRDDEMARKPHRLSGQGLDLPSRPGDEYFICPIARHWPIALQLP